MSSQQGKGHPTDSRTPSLFTRVGETLGYHHNLGRLLQEDSECGAPTESVTAESSTDAGSPATLPRDSTDLNIRKERKKARRQTRSKLAKISFTRKTTAYEAGRRFAAEDGKLAEHEGNWLFQQSLALQRLNTRKLGRSFKRGISTYIREYRGGKQTVEDRLQTTIPIPERTT